MKKCLLIGFLILVFSITGFAQAAPKFKIQDFVLAKIEPSKTAIFVGDRFKLRLEIIYLKDIGIKILIEELEKDSFAMFLPDSIILEKAEVSQPIPWNEFWTKIEAVYTLFYPEKKHNIGILFFPSDSKPLKIRFKWIDEKDKDIRTDVEIYEVDVRPGQFVLGVGSTLTDTSRSPRDYKLFFGNFFLKYWIGMVVGFVLVLVAVFTPIKAAVNYVKERSRQKKISVEQLLRAEYKNLRVIRDISDIREFADSFCFFLRNLIGIKTGTNTLSMTAAETKQIVSEKDEKLVELATILENYDDFRYNPLSKPESPDKVLKTVDNILLGWIASDRWHKKLEAVAGGLIRKIKARIEKWKN